MDELTPERRNELIAQGRIDEIVTPKRIREVMRVEMEPFEPLTYKSNLEMSEASYGQGAALGGGIAALIGAGLGPVGGFVYAFITNEQPSTGYLVVGGAVGGGALGAVIGLAAQFYTRWCGRGNLREQEERMGSEGFEVLRKEYEEAFERGRSLDYKIKHGLWPPDVSK